MALARIDPRSAKAGEVLLPLLDAKDLEVRKSAAISLGYLEAHAGRAVASCLRDLTSADGAVQAAAAGALEDLSRSDHTAKEMREAVPALVRMLGGGASFEVQSACVVALLGIGPAAAPARPALLDLVRHGKETNLRQAALNALRSVGVTVEDIPPLLEEFLKEPILAGHAAVTIGSAGKPAVPVLLDLFRKGDHDQKLAALSGLQVAGTEAREALPALREALEGKEVKEEDVRTQVRWTIWFIEGRKGPRP
jgi:HEAT repeat protein